MYPQLRLRGRAGVERWGDGLLFEQVVVRERIFRVGGLVGVRISSGGWGR